jgi:hypothetical protein
MPARNAFTSEDRIWLKSWFEGHLLTHVNRLDGRLMNVPFEGEDIHTRGKSYLRDNLGETLSTETVPVTVMQEPYLSLLVEDIIKARKLYVSCPC